MLVYAYVRLVVRAFSAFWYAICGAAILFGLFELLVGLAAVLNLNLLGVSPADGPGFLAIAILTIAAGVEALNESSQSEYTISLQSSTSALRT